jgi:hypothetical protein
LASKAISGQIPTKNNHRGGIVADSNLLSRIKLGTSNAKLVKWPGSEELVSLRILSLQERQEAGFATERHFKTSGIDLNMATATDYDEEKAIQMLWRALKDPKENAPLCKDIGGFRCALTREEKTTLIDEYLTFERDCAPSPENLTAEEFDLFVSEVKKTPEEMLSASYSTSMLKKLCKSLASQLAIALSRNSSGSAAQGTLSNSDATTQDGNQ